MTMRVALILLVVCLAACTHRAPIERTEYPPTRDGLAEALRDYVAAPERAKPRLWLTVAAPESVTEQRPRPLPTFWFSARGSQSSLADVYASGCPGPDPCPELLTGRAAFLLDNLNKRIERLDLTEDGLVEGLRRATELGSQSSVAVDLDLPGFDEPAGWDWKGASHSYDSAGDYVCEFGSGPRPPPICWPAQTFKRIAIVTPDLDFTYLEATPENLERVDELWAAHPGAWIRVERLWPNYGSGDGISPGEARVIAAFGDSEVCGVFGDLGQFDEHCFAFDALRSVSIAQRGAREPWSPADYATLPLRIAVGVVVSLPVSGGG